MPKVSKESATQGGDYGAVLDRFEEVEGYTLSFVSFREDIDATPLYRGCRTTAVSTRTGATC